MELKTAFIPWARVRFVNKERIPWACRKIELLQRTYCFLIMRVHPMPN